VSKASFALNELQISVHYLLSLKAQEMSNRLKRTYSNFSTGFAD
jgi:hypothetical protein